jgi:hypothetical protein
VAFPVVAATNETAVSTAGTSHVLNLPANIAAGNLLVIILDKGSTQASFNSLAGWTEIVDENLANGITVWARQADGAEGSTVTFTSDASTRSASFSYRITGAIPLSVQAPQLSTVATGTSTAPNATTCTPTGGAKDYLWITFFGMAGEQADDESVVTTFPTNYTDNQLEKTCGVAGTNLGGMIGAASRNLNAASEDAGAFVAVDNAAWRAYTLAVHPIIDTLCTPTTLALTTASFAPTVRTPRLATPSTASLTITTFAPTVTATEQQAGYFSMLAWWVGGAGSVNNNALVTPSTATLTLTTFAPTVSTPRLVTPGLATLTTSTFAPTVSTPRLVTPSTATLTTTTFAPTVSTPRLVTPTTKALTLTTFAPTVVNPKSATPSTASLTLTTFAPSVSTTASGSFVPSTATLSLSTFAPTVSTPRTVTPSTASLALTAFAPSVLTPRLVTPAAGSLSLSTFAPTVTVALPGQGGLLMLRRRMAL